MNLYSNAKKFGLTAAGYIWLVSSEAAQDVALENAPHGENFLVKICILSHS